jgi:hypothetical protein
LYLCGWKITHPFSYYVASLSLGPRANQEARRLEWKGFDHEVEWAVLLPRLTGIRALDEFAEEIAVLLMENCSSDIARHVIRLLQRHECGS